MSWLEAFAQKPPYFPFLPAEHLSAWFADNVCVGVNAGSLALKQGPYFQYLAVLLGLCWRDVGSSGEKAGLLKGGNAACS